MTEKWNRSRVQGFLHAEGRRLCNGAGEEVLLAGWGLGNWLLCEGYMWLAGEGTRFERPRRIETVIRELAGEAFANDFWPRFREAYTTREDVRRMAELGYNSLRIPLSWRLLMEDGPGVHWNEAGFRLVDRCLDWCEEFGLYAFLDLHAAPGGQTGSNIDDSVDDFPRLFTDTDSWEKGVALWGELARRYADRWIVGGYDLLNEPLRPAWPGAKSCEHLLPELVRFYEAAIAAVRRWDTRHLIALEGHHWATDTTVFCKRYDSNLALHFHRYACLPDIACYREYLETAERWNLPLWLGETGENTAEWYAAMFPLAAELGIGFTLWPWKKMECANSPLSIAAPAGWERIIGYTQGGPRPGYGEAQAILEQFLENCMAENCRQNPEVTAAIFRRPGCGLRGTDFDHFPGKDASFSGLREEDSLSGYRKGTGMAIRPSSVPIPEKRFAFDCLWDALTLELSAGEFASYTVCPMGAGASVALDVRPREASEAVLEQDGREIARWSLPPDETVQSLPPVPLGPAAETVLTVRVPKGRLELERLRLLPEQGD